VWSLEYSVEAERDFELIFDHLFAAYCDLGDHPDEALECAAGRVHGLRMLINGSPRSEHCDPIFIRASAVCDETRAAANGPTSKLTSGRESNYFDQEALTSDNRSLSMIRRLTQSRQLQRKHSFISLPVNGAFAMMSMR